MTEPPPRDSKSALLEAAHAAVEDQVQKAQDRAIRPVAAQRGPLLVFGVIAVTGIVLLVWQPTWLAGPRTLPAESPTVVTAGLRIGLIRQRQRVFDYFTAHGRLPTSLAETGDSMPGVSYARQEDTAFTLTAGAGDSIVVLRSGDAQASFLGNSLRIIKRRGSP
ncbi:MAG TPA: hypothetical protein VFU23_14405 [Gemmatimonadales bacterium]|nr:hypothetical protein [Gemmatimonadales bacterium]